MADKKPDTPPAKSHSPALPQQLRDQMAAAEAIRAGTEQPAAPAVADGTASPPASHTTPSSPSQEPAAPPVTTQPAAPVADDGQTWEQRFRSQAGRLEQSQRANQQLAERLEGMERLIGQMQARGVETPTEPEPAPLVKPKLVTDKEAEEYGNEFLEVVGKRAREEYIPEFNDLAARLRRLEGRVEGVGTVVEKTQTNDVYAGLGNSVPNWRDVNRSEEFKAWLQEPDAFSGRRRHDMLTEAFSRHETSRVVAFFKGFLTEATGLPQETQASATAPQAPQNGNGSGKPSLETFAAPGRARSAPQDLPPDKPIYTNAWIAQFMADKRTGKYRGREADAEAIERDIYQAQHEGRIH